MTEKQSQTKSTQWNKQQTGPTKKQQPLHKRTTFILRYQLGQSEKVLVCYNGKLTIQGEQKQF